MRHTKDDRVAKQRRLAYRHCDCLDNPGAAYLWASLLYQIIYLISGQFQLGFLLEKVSGSLEKCSQAQEHQPHLETC